MKIGLDFDRVLFKTDKFNKYLKEETELHHVDVNVYDSEGCYSPEKHADACGIDVEEVYEAISGISRFLYSDVDELRKLKPEHEIVIVTRGEERFQKEKVNASGANRLFDELFIVQNAPKNVDGVDFLVDDLEEEVKRSGLPGLVFDRKKHSMEDVIKEVRALET
jgi:FMN phosphatase YigB (HAD superfamily)